MTEVSELTYDRLAYWEGSEKLICSSALGTRVHKIRLTMSSGYIEGTQVNMQKNGDLWCWISSAKYPMVVYERAIQILNSFFPNATNGEIKSVWLKVEVLES